jgi:hypothetical protein
MVAQRRTPRQERLVVCPEPFRSKHCASSIEL